MNCLEYIHQKLAQGDTAPCIPERLGIHQSCGWGHGYSYSTTKPLPCHCHEYCELFLTLSDHVIHVINGCEIPLPANTLVFVRPQDIHTQHYADISDNKEMLNITFTRTALEALFGYLEQAGMDCEQLLLAPMPPTIHLSDLQSREIQVEFEKRLLYHHAKPQSRLYLHGFLCFVFVNFLSNIKIVSGEHPPMWLESTCEKMKQVKNFTAGLSRMLEISGKSQEHLARSMKKYYGITTTKFINDLRLNYAAGRLRDTVGEESLLSLIYDCGFQSPTHFYALFKEKYGMSPMEYRQRNQ